MPVTEYLSSEMWTLLGWLLQSVALMLLGRKLKWQKLWRLLIPGVGYIRLGKTLNDEVDGRVAAVLDVLTTVVQLIPTAALDERVSIAVSLVALVIYILMMIYHIKIVLRLLTYFNMKRVWVLLGVVYPAILVLIIALSKRFQPVNPDALNEDWKAGTAPAAIPGSDKGGFVPAQTGLSIDIKERVVRDNSKKRYLLKDIRLNIPNGSLVLLLGGSGAGKTTLLNAVIGYEKADATILLNGSDVYKDYARMKYRIGFVPQQNLIRGSDTVLRTIGDASLMRLPLSVEKGERHEKLDGVMDLLGLSAGCHGLVGKKSGGQLRRISIAMELIADPELFVLDEPDSGLDGVIARELFTKLRGIADEGKIVMVITHTPDRVIDLFDKVIVLARDSGRCGRLAFYGSPQEAREFFGKDSMEGVVMSINSKDAGGDGLADEYIERYANRVSSEKAGAAV